MKPSSQNVGVRAAGYEHSANRGNISLASAIFFKFGDVGDVQSNEIMKVYGVRMLN